MKGQGFINCSVTILLCSYLIFHKYFNLHTFFLLCHIFVPFIDAWLFLKPMALVTNTANCPLSENKHNQCRYSEKILHMFETDTVYAKAV